MAERGCRRVSDEHQINRRDFLKNAAAAGAVVGAAGAGALALAGETLGAATAGDVYKRPWWVRQVDEPTTGVNWEAVQRVNARTNILIGEGWRRLVGTDEAARMQQITAENEQQRILNAVSGYTLKDYALDAAFTAGQHTMHRSFLGSQQAKTPEERGVPRWSGTPAVAAQIIKVAMRHMGAASVGIVHLDERTRRLIYSVDPDGKELVFEDVPTAYEDESRRVIPNRAEWVIVYAVQMSTETMKRAPTKLAEMTTELSYLRGLTIQNSLQEFLRGLGYQGLGEATLNGLGIAPALAVMGGLGELSRQNRVITPEYGPMVRLFKLITDLPLAPDRPIDAGIARFCRTCKKCAEACPPGALSFDTEPGWTPVGSWNQAGHQAWFEDSRKCRTYWHEKAGTNCGICFSVCPFSKMGKSFVHRLIQMQIATVPAADDLTRNLDDAFGYGVQKDPETWWQLDLPEMGIDTHKGQ